MALSVSYVLLSTDVDECESSPCVQGNCTDQVDGYVCECFPGYRGPNCDTGKKKSSKPVSWTNKLPTKYLIITSILCLRTNA